MFKKAFKVKSNTQIKSSERKNLKDLLLKKFDGLQETDIEIILPKKEVAFCTKLLTSDDKHVLVYSVQKRAMFFCVEDIYFPTVYLLFKLPYLLTTFTTNSFVISKIAGGADLMLPGIIRNAAQLPFLSKHVACINTINNKMPVAVGLTAMSFTEMSKAQGGKCLVVYHWHGDKLCTLDDMPILNVPQLGPPHWLNYQIDDDDEFPELSPTTKTATKEEVNTEPVLDCAENSIDTEIDNEKTESDCKPLPLVDPVDEMDTLLINCFLTAIKYSKTLEIPMLTSSFYKLEILPTCPADKVLDIKKSSFKKVGVFLKQMNKDGIIIVKEKKKGVETLEGINKDHPMFVNFYVDIDNRPKRPITEEENASARQVVESYVVTYAVAPIFKESGLNKGDTVLAGAVRQYVTNYVRKYNCQDPDNKKFVKVGDNPCLSSLCKNEKAVTWEDLMEKVTSTMKSCFKITGETGAPETVNKGKIQPIAMIVQTRSGNKKVTIIDNLELYNIRMSEFAKECQHGVAASTCISRPPGKKSDQILIQGNQILFVYNLLTEKYKIPKKYIRGLENAPKTRK